MCPEAVFRVKTLLLICTFFFWCATIFFLSATTFFLVCNKQSSMNNASIAQLAEHLLRKEKVTSSILVGGWATGSHGLVGYDARLTRERSRVRASVRIKCLSFCFCFILSASFIDKKKHTQKEKANIGCTMIYGLFCGPGGRKKCVQTYDTQDSRMVPHCSTNWAQQCLTSQFGWDAVSSLWCDRKTLPCVLDLYSTG